MSRLLIRSSRSTDPQPRRTSSSSSANHSTSTSIISWKRRNHADVSPDGTARVMRPRLWCVVASHKKSNNDIPGVQRTLSPLSGGSVVGSARFFFCSEIRIWSRRGYQRSRFNHNSSDKGNERAVHGRGRSPARTTPLVSSTTPLRMNGHWTHQNGSIGRSPPTTDDHPAEMGRGAAPAQTPACVSGVPSCATHRIHQGRP